MTISLDVKKKCVELKRAGKTSRQIYTEYFAQHHTGMGYETFRAKLKHWQKQIFADSETLDSGTYEGFIAHGATVQVNGKGEIVQSWIKQHADDQQIFRLAEYIRENTLPRILPRPEGKAEEQMLEIPLFDQHFPLSDHRQSLYELLEIVESKVWEEINIIIGQDMFHNDDLRGRTSSGRSIEKVDMVKAWEMARDFWATVIESAETHSKNVKITYSKGNHDESMSWAFVQMLKAMYPDIAVDDTLDQRKLIYWKGCFIGVTHGAYKRSGKNDLRGQFTIQFPVAFASADVREIHTGHLHHEEEGDVYGVMCRRLSRNGELDEWSDDEGFVGANKRFMVFRWKPGRLAGIEYI